MFQLLRGKFEGFLKQLEVGEERFQSCSDVAARLIRSKHPQSSAVRDTLEQLGYLQRHIISQYSDELKMFFTFEKSTNTCDHMFREARNDKLNR